MLVFCKLENVFLGHTAGKSMFIQVQIIPFVVSIVILLSNLANKWFACQAL